MRGNIANDNMMTGGWAGTTKDDNPRNYSLGKCATKKTEKTNKC